MTKEPHTPPIAKRQHLCNDVWRVDIDDIAKKVMGWLQNLDRCLVQPLKGIKGRSDVLDIYDSLVAKRSLVEKTTIEFQKLLAEVDREHEIDMKTDTDTTEGDEVDEITPPPARPGTPIPPPPSQVPSNPAASTTMDISTSAGPRKRGKKCEDPSIWKPVKVVLYHTQPKRWQTAPNTQDNWNAPQREEGLQNDPYPKQEDFIKDSKLICDKKRISRRRQTLLQDRSPIESTIAGDITMRPHHIPKVQTNQSNSCTTKSRISRSLWESKIAC